MSNFEVWIIAFAIGVIALTFIVLVVFTVMMLISMRRTLKSTTEVCDDLNDKFHSLDPLFRMAHGVGSKIENTRCMRGLTDEIEESIYEERIHRSEENTNTTLEVAEWALIGLSLWNKIKKRR